VVFFTQDGRLGGRQALFPMTVNFNKKELTGSAATNTRQRSRSAMHKWLDPVPVLGIRVIQGERDESQESGAGQGAQHRVLTAPAINAGWCKP